MQSDLEETLSWRDKVVEYIKENARPVDKFDHQPRLYVETTRIGEGLAYDDDVVFAAVWMHDLGVFVGHRPEDPAELAKWDNTEYACRRTPELLRSFGFPEEKIPAVVDAIRTHQPHCKPATIEGSILRDADILEQLGAVAVLRAVAKIGRDTRFPTYREVVPLLGKALRLPEVLTFDRSKELARPKVEALAAFLSAVRSETESPA